MRTTAGANTGRAGRRDRRRHGVAALAAGSLVMAGLTVTGVSSPAQAVGTSCALNSSFGRMFPALPKASWTVDELSRLAQKTMEVDHFQPTLSPRDEMPNFPAGYNYFGQFVDHDITREGRDSDLLTPVAPSAMVNGRTPALDLDSLYTGDLDAYTADGHFKLGAELTEAESDRGARDLYRGATGQAVIGDDRNDENKIVASFHSIMTRFHNKVLDMNRRDHPLWTDWEVFQQTKQDVTKYYQYALLTDFLPKIVGSTELSQVVKRTYLTGWTTSLKFYDSCNGSMPTEFSGAAYRFGHSLVRNDYEINEKHSNLEVFTSDFNPRSSLVGFGPSPKDFAIDWKYFLDLPERTSTTPQDAYQFDNSLVPALRRLPGPAAAGQSTVLATRNLLRGVQIGLPSGQDVARAMGVTPLPDSKIWIGPAVAGTPAGMTVPITSVSPAFAGKAPLWTYILAEAAEANTIQSSTTPGKTNGLKRSPERLGPVGGRIVAETFVGLLKADPSSVLNDPTWTPDKRMTSALDRFRISDFVSVATNLGPTGIYHGDIDQTDGTVDVGKTAVGLERREAILVRNLSRGTVELGQPVYTGAASMRLSSLTTCGVSVLKLGPGGSCYVWITYKPTAAGPVTGRMTLPTTGASGTLWADLKASTL